MGQHDEHHNRRLIIAGGDGLAVQKMLERVGSGWFRRKLWFGGFFVEHILNMEMWLYFEGSGIEFVSIQSH